MEEFAATTVGALLHNFTERLEAAGVYAPLRDAQALVAHALGVPDDDRAFSIPLGRVVEPAVAHLAESYVQRREKREPLARILGHTTFWGLPFHVVEHVFRPDPQVETLIESALIILKERRGHPLRILDLGTGSGCLLLSLLHELPAATGIGVDIDQRSLAAASGNAERLGLTERARFLLSRWGEALDETFDLIMANPPAVVDRTWPLLDPEMRDHETPISLLGGEDGLDCYRDILKDVNRLLKRDGLLLLRAHTWDREARLVKKSGYKGVEVMGNYRQNPSCVVACAKTESALSRLLQKGRDLFRLFA